MTERIRHKENLDNFELKGPELTETLESLGWINRWLGNHNFLLKELTALINKYPEQTNFRIVDLGCGGGDVLRKIEKRFKAKSIHFDLIGIDANAHSLAYAKLQSSAQSCISFQHADILADDFRIPTCDILISSHFIYHFSDKGLAQFIQNNSANFKLGFINSGLRNSKVALFLFKYFSWLLPITNMAKLDGQQAIKSAFKKSQLISILESIPNLQFEIKSSLFFRLTLIIE